MSDTSGSVYTWVAVSSGSNPNNSANWVLTSGTGNSAGYPIYPGDGAIIPASASMLAISNSNSLDNSYDLKGGSVSFTDSGLLGPVSYFTFGGTPTAGDVVSVTIATATDPTPFSVTYDVTSFDTDAIIAQQVGQLLQDAESSAAAALGYYVVNSAGPNDTSLSIGTFAGVAPTVTVSITNSGGTAGTTVTTPTIYDASTVTDSGTAAGGSASFFAEGAVHNGGVITADVPGADFVITVETASSISSGGSTTTATGDFVNLNQLLVTSGGTLSILAADSGSVVDNYGTIDVADGNLVISAPFENDQGTIQIGGSGRATIETLVGERQRVVFDTASAGGILQIDPGALVGGAFAPKIVGFSNGDEIYLPGVTYVGGAIDGSYSSGILTVTSSGTTVLTASLQTGSFNNTSFSFGIGGGGTGLDIFTTADAARWVGSAGTSDWSTAANWSPAAVPDSSGTSVVIDSGAPTGGTLDTGSSALAAGSLELDSPAGFTLDVQGDLTLKRSLLDFGNNVTIATSGATLTAAAFLELGGDASLSVTAGELLLSGGSSPDDDGATGALFTGTALIDDATLDAGGGGGSDGGYIAIGTGAPTGAVTAQDGASVTATYTALGSNIGGSTLTITGAGTSWTDTADDPTVSAVYGSVLPGMVVGISDGTAGAAAYLTVANSATLTDQGAAVIGTSAGFGQAVVTNGATWTVNGADVIVGADSGFGELAVTSGGSLEVASGGNVIVGGSGGGYGEVTISGSGAGISAAGSMVVGGNGAAFGDLLVADGGSVTAGGADVGGAAEEAQVAVDGAGTLLHLSGDLGIASGATISEALGGTIVVGSGGGTADAATVTPGYLAEGAGTIEGEVIDNGSVFASGAGQTLELPGLVQGTGTLGIDHGATLELYSRDGTAPQEDAATVVFSGTSGTLALGTPGSMYGEIQNFGGANVIDLLDVGPTNLHLDYNSTNGVLEITSGTGGSPRVIANLEIGTGYGGYTFSTPVSDGATGSLIAAIPCYCRGTRILTDRGEVAVEELTVGDRLVTRSGEARALRWIGHRAYAGQFAAANPAALPVLIRQGAIAEGLPRRNLLVSPLHALFLEGALIPVRALVNGGSIVQLRSADRVEYFHLELDSHDVILAEGLPAESYVDDGNRGMFQNAGDHPAGPDADPAAAVYCAPRFESGPLVEQVRAQLGARGVWLGLTPAKSTVIELREAGLAMVPVPPNVGALRLVTPSGVNGLDVRRLGALIRGFVLEGVPFELADPRFVRGFYPVETHGENVVRWTDGEALVVLDPKPFTRWCEISVASVIEADPAPAEWLSVPLREEGVTRVLVPGGIGELHLVSSWGEGDGDVRRLGALVTRVAIGGEPLQLHDPRLVCGFHPVEDHDSHQVRWTDGDAVIMFDPAPAPQWCEIEVKALMGRADGLVPRLNAG